MGLIKGSGMDNIRKATRPWYCILLSPSKILTNRILIITHEPCTFKQGFQASRDPLNYVLRGGYKACGRSIYLLFAGDSERLSAGHFRVVG